MLKGFEIYEKIHDLRSKLGQKRFEMFTLTNVNISWRNEDELLAKQNEIKSLELELRQWEDGYFKKIRRINMTIEKCTVFTSDQNDVEVHFEIASVPRDTITESSMKADAQNIFEFLQYLPAGTLKSLSDKLTKFLN